MNKLLLRISELPQSIQDIIGMYNVEHRKQMKIICEELVENNRCDDCQDFMNKYRTICVRMYCQEYYYCSELCAQRDQEEMIRRDNRIYISKGRYA